MDRETERLRKRTNPDGYENDGTPYWVLPSDRKTYSYEEWYEQDRNINGKVMEIDITENELKEKLVDAIYTIVKRIPDFCPDYHQIAKNGADVIMDIIKEYNKIEELDKTHKI